MDFAETATVEALKLRVLAFMREHVTPADTAFLRAASEGRHPLSMLRKTLTARRCQFSIR